MKIYFRSLTALAADAAFLASVGLEAASIIVDELGQYLAKRAGVPYAASELGL